MHQRTVGNAAQWKHELKQVGVDVVSDTSKVVFPTHVNITGELDHNQARCVISKRWWGGSSGPITDVPVVNTQYDLVIKDNETGVTADLNELVMNKFTLSYVEIGSSDEGKEKYEAEIKYIGTETITIKGIIVLECNVQTANTHFELRVRKQNSNVDTWRGRFVLGSSVHDTQSVTGACVIAPNEKLTFNVARTTGSDNDLDLTGFYFEAVEVD